MNSANSRGFPLTMTAIFERLRSAFEQWKNGGMMKLSINDDDSMTFSYPDPRVKEQRQALLKFLGSPFVVATASGVAAGAILKFLGLL